MSLDQVQNTGGEEEAAGGAQAEAVAATAALSSYPVAPGYRLNVRSGPGTNYSLVRVLPVGSRVSINCQRPGEWVSGPYGTSNIWDNIGSGQYVSDAYIRTGSDGYVAPRC
ncbi:SH3 domain-containing protein [Streptomyces sp. NPDC085944]|uniref:SH3 domain-containing protein n=1 Tax=Streptomyces sp. NPDC085944 TaxID=3154962 RepID=UPI003434DFF8